METSRIELIKYKLQKDGRFYLDCDNSCGLTRVCLMKDKDAVWRRIVNLENFLPYFDFLHFVSDEDIIRAILFELQLYSF